jgi:hypothetical protein
MRRAVLILASIGAMALAGVAVAPAASAAGSLAVCRGFSTEVPVLPADRRVLATTACGGRAQPVQGGATPQPQCGTGALRTTSAPGWELVSASRVPHST